MKQGVLQDESMDIHEALMSNGVEQQEHEENNITWRKTVEKKRQDWNWNNTQVWTKNLTQTKRMDAPKA